jgi:hypothetical protein
VCTRRSVLDILVHGLHAYQEYRDVHQLSTGHAAASVAAIIGGYQAQRSLEEVYNLRMRIFEIRKRSQVRMSFRPQILINPPNEVAYRSPYPRAERHRRRS